LALVWSQDERDRIKKHIDYNKSSNNYVNSSGVTLQGIDIGNKAVWNGEKCTSRSPDDGSGSSGNGAWTSPYFKDSDTLWKNGLPNEKCSDGGECSVFNLDG